MTLDEAAGERTVSPMLKTPRYSPLFISLLDYCAAANKEDTRPHVLPMCSAVASKKTGNGIKDNTTHTKKYPEVHDIFIKV